MNSILYNLKSMESKSLTIPFVLIEATEREIYEKIAPQLKGTISGIKFSDIISIRGNPYRNVTINYRPWFSSGVMEEQFSQSSYCPSREWNA